MGRSFFGGNDAQLNAGTIAFATQISATPTVFGLTSAQATSYQTLSTAYTTSYLAALNPLTRTKAKVQAKNDARTALKLLASELAKLIEGTATVTPEQKVALGLSVRGTPTPVNTLGQPNKFKIELSLDGSMLVKWQCSSPRATGVVYQIWRKLDSDTDYVYQGGTGEKNWPDATIPSGTAQATYKIQAVRSTAAGPWAVLAISFGTSSSGAITASVRTAPKLAA